MAFLHFPYGPSLSLSVSSPSFFFPIFPTERDVDMIGLGGGGWVARDRRHFKTVEEFQKLIDYNGFIEWAQYVENYYGTPKKFVEDELAKGNNVILEIEVQGAMHIKEQYPEAVLIFITAPDARTLKERLEGRGTEDAKVIAKRLKRAYEETDDMVQYDYLVVNGDIDTCVDDIHSVIRAESFMTSRNDDYMVNMKEQLKSIREK